MLKGPKSLRQRPVVGFVLRTGFGHSSTTGKCGVPQSQEPVAHTITVAIREGSMDHLMLHLRARLIQPV